MTIVDFILINTFVGIPLLLGLTYAFAKYLQRDNDLRFRIVEQEQSASNKRIADLLDERVRDQKNNDRNIAELRHDYECKLQLQQQKMDTQEQKITQQEQKIDEQDKQIRLQKQLIDELTSIVERLREQLHNAKR